jgi:hypothetical protein
MKKSQMLSTHTHQYTPDWRHRTTSPKLAKSPIRTILKAEWNIEGIGWNNVGLTFVLGAEGNP